jgi:hypothetical protein
MSNSGKTWGANFKMRGEDMLFWKLRLQLQSMSHICKSTSLLCMNCLFHSMTLFMLDCDHSLITLCCFMYFWWEFKRLTPKCQRIKKCIEK